MSVRGFKVNALEPATRGEKGRPGVPSRTVLRPRGERKEAASRETIGFVSVRACWRRDAAIRSNETSRAPREAES